jgi:hypothetical protein
MMCNSKRLALVAVGLVSIGLLAKPAVALPTVFFGWDNKDGNVDPHPKSQKRFDRFTGTLNSYDVDGAENEVPLDFFPVLDFPAIGITASTQGVTVVPAPTYDLDEQAFIEYEAFDPMGPEFNTVFSLSAHVNAFGLYVIQGGDRLHDNLTNFIFRDTVSNTQVVVPIQIGNGAAAGWGENNIFFLGMHDPSFLFNEVVIDESADGPDSMLYDNVVAGFVPEPGSLALVMFGAAFALCKKARFRRG